MSTRNFIGTFRRIGTTHNVKVFSEKKEQALKYYYLKCGSKMYIDLSPREWRLITRSNG